MTRLLPIRGEEPPDDTILIIRAGVMAPESVRHTATDTFEDYGLYLVSVEAVLEGTVETTCQTSPRIGDLYGKIRLSRAEGCGAPGSCSSPPSTGPITTWRSPSSATPSSPASMAASMLPFPTLGDPDREYPDEGG